MRRRRNVKIVATLGPASDEEETIVRLFDAGADVFRINMSHTGHDQLRDVHRRVREVEEERGRPIGILLDLQGPKLRLGTFDGGEAVLKAGERVTLDSDPAPGDATRVQVPHPEIFKSLEEGKAVLLNDGRVRLRVEARGAGSVTCRVEVGGVVSDRKGINLPETMLPLTPITEKDRADLEAGLNLGIDWVALSFIQRPEDLAEARKMTRGRAAVMAKLEKPLAVDRLTDIIEMSDGLMVARGDLGVELPLERLPGLQKQVIRACRRAGKPVVVATQMLESMISSALPTRAEVSDVATAVFEGADAVMLSAESATGRYPIDAVATMNRIAEEVETDPNYRSIIMAQRAEPEATGPDAISAAARSVAETLSLASVVCYTSSGATGLRMARERPARPIIALTPTPATGRRLALAWGLHCVLTEDARDENDMVDRACRIAFQEDFAQPGQRIIITAGVPFGTPGATNMLRIAFVGRDGAGAE
jgi:pyruvate kinase